MLQCMRRMDVEEIVRDIEDTIRILTTTDCETNLKAISTLEETSYKLWVDSNTAFLDETFISTCTEEENWFWDDDFIFEAKQYESIWSLDNESVGAPDLSSSISTTCSDCEDSFSSHGYHADAEASVSSTMTSMTDNELETLNSRRQSSTVRRFKRKRVNTKLTFSELGDSAAIESLNLYDDWVIVGESDLSFDKTTVLPILCSSPRKEVVPMRDSDSVEDDEDDWTILSVKITEVKDVVGKHLCREPSFDTSRDSGIISPELYSLWEKYEALSIQSGYRKCVPHR